MLAEDWENASDVVCNFLLKKYLKERFSWIQIKDYTYNDAQYLVHYCLFDMDNWCVTRTDSL